ncbi:MAG TPA: neutral/alkaline non-lysosomal ceramidase N-terminal domain-containing protein [archaeon]|nr:neutral/alkaline non-lysosomal ceramidase N-terminal domain-containing protein [archaeon]
MRTGRLFYLPIAVLLFSAQLAWGIEAGVSQLEITPATGLQMAGYGGKNNISTGVLDPLYVRALVFRSDERSIGFVVYDLIFPFGKEISDQLRQRISAATGLKEVVFLSTHTHSGPVIDSEPKMKKGEKIEDLPEYEQVICEKTLDALKSAYKSLEPVQLGTGWGKVDLSYNRIKVNPDDGRVEMVWQNHQKIPMGPVDQTVGVIKIDDLSGNTIAVLVNYACHPVIHRRPETNLVYSADFPGVLCREVQKGIKGGPVCIFFQGAPGDMNPYYAHSVDNPVSRLEEAGGELANEVMRVAGTIETRPYTGEFSVLYKIKDLETTIRWDTEKLSSTEGDENVPERIKRLTDKGKNFKIPLSVVLITPEIGFVGLPGEFFVKFQQDIRQQSPVDFLFVSGYTNGAFGYFPTISAAEKGGYGANDYATYTAEGTGEHLTIEAIVALNELLGRLRPIPAKPENGYRY